jgi:hypothetical protein
MEELRKSYPGCIVEIFPLEWFAELQAFVRDHYVFEKDVRLPTKPYRILLYRRRHDIQ